MLIVDADKEGEYAALSQVSYTTLTLTFMTGYVRTYIILPSTIYGLARGLLVDIGVSNNRSIQIPAIIEASLDRKQGGMVGQGKNLWPNVHIDERAYSFRFLLEI